MGINTCQGYQKPMDDEMGYRGGRGRGGGRGVLDILDDLDTRLLLNMIMSEVSCSLIAVQSFKLVD